MKPAVVGFVFACGVAVLIWQGLSAKVDVLQIHQVKAEASSGQRVQVDGGKVVAVESLSPLKFWIAPEGNAATRLRVESSEIVPENFKVGASVSIRGQYDSDAATFRAYRVTTACPSKYRAAEEAVAGETQGGGAYGGPAVPAAPES